MTQFGDTIRAGTVGYPVAGVRPAWLEGYDKKLIVHWTNGVATHPQFLLCFPSSSWQSITAFVIDKDHWAYKAINAGYTPWAGGDAAPADWDGGATLLRDGTYRIPMSKNSGLWQHTTAMSQADIIGYKRNTVPHNGHDAPTVKLCDWCSRPVDAPEPQPLYNQARRLLDVLCERFGTPATPGLDVAEILTQIDNVTTGVHIRTLDACILRVSPRAAGFTDTAMIINKERDGIQRQLEALRPAPADPIEALAIELHGVVNDLPHADAVAWDKMPDTLRKTYRALARHTLDRQPQT